MDYLEEFCKYTDNPPLYPRQSAKPFLGGKFYKRPKALNEVTCLRIMGKCINASELSAIMFCCWIYVFISDNMQLSNSLWIYLMCSNIKVHVHDISNFVESYKDISNKHENLKSSKSSKLAIIKTFV